MKRWKVDAGNSTDGPVGFVVYDIKAETREDALAKIKAALPRHIESKEWTEWNETVTVISYFNADALTLDNIEEDEDEEEERDGTMDAQPHCACGCDLRDGVCPEGCAQADEDDDEAGA